MYEEFQLKMRLPVSWIVSCCLILHPLYDGLKAQQPSGTLRILILEGEGGMNNIRQRLARDLIVQVDNEAGVAVPKANVTFTLPEVGASGTFPDGNKSAIVATDGQGRAIVRGIRPNQVAGRFEIRVSASHQGQTGRAVITQFNMAVAESVAPKSGKGKILAIFAVAGAAAAGGVIVATQKSGVTGPAVTAAPPISVTAGAGTVGPPQ